jgi:hypothetical protein
LCKCDPLSAKKLLNLTSNLRGLYIRYPAATLQAILAQIPSPVATLLWLSWDLSNRSDDDFDPSATLELLQQFHLFEWPVAQPNMLILAGNPEDALRALADLYTEVDEAANLIGECMITGMHMFHEPWLQPPPITLSDTEHIRLVCSLWVVKIYYQMQLKFNRLSQERAVAFPAAFIKNLEPWQLEQGLSIDRFLQGYCHDRADSLHRIIDRKSGLLKRLSQSLYVSNAFNFFDTFSTTVSIPRMNRHSRGPWARAPGDISHPSRLSLMTTQLRNQTWISLESTLHSAVFDQTMAMTCQVGLLFWDLNRLMYWRISGSDELHDATNRYYNYLRSDCASARRSQCSPHYMCEHPARIEQNKSRQIIEWTRCPVQLPLEEWLYQKTAISRLEQGRTFLPRECIESGTTCRNCGLDGHRQSKCNAEL